MMLPFEAEMPSENIVPPSVGDQADCNKVNTCHVDEFLYDEHDVDNLVKHGQLKRRFCIDCNSHNVSVSVLTSYTFAFTQLFILVELN